MESLDRISADVMVHTGIFATVLMDHRLALVALVALLILAAAPLAYTWARLLPEDRPPFELPTTAGTIPEDVASTANAPATKDPFAIVLLACVTLSYVLRFPGLPLSGWVQRLSTVMPADYSYWAVMGGRAFFVVVPGLAAVYSILRPNPVRTALAVGGLLVLALWLLSPLLQKAIIEG